MIEENKNSYSRKNFLKICGLSAAGAALSSCTEIPSAIDDLPPLQIKPDPRPDDYRIWIGNGDLSLMNTIHLYTRLEAAFYTKVLENPYDGITAKERTVLTALRDHEVAHSDFLDVLLKENAIQDYKYYKTDTRYNFTYFDFDKRSEILEAAINFENIGVAMYNGFPRLFKRTELVAILAKLGSVEARHAASLRFFLDREFGSYIGSTGLDTFKDPRIAWDAFWYYIWRGFDIHGLPSP